LVIQRVLEGDRPRSVYRLVVYPAPRGLALKPANFLSREDVIECLQAAIPAFDEIWLGTGLNTQVVFAEVLEFTTEQLIALGVVQQTSQLEGPRSCR
jgi:hypothetical protein